MTAKARLAKPTTRERRHRSARYPIGSAPSTKNALGGGGDERDDTVGDAEGVSNVGSEDAQRGVLEFVEAVQQQQDRERERAAAQQTLL